MEYCHEKRPDSPTYTLEPYFLKIVSDLLRHRYLQYMYSIFEGSKYTKITDGFDVQSALSVSLSPVAS